MDVLYGNLEPIEAPGFWNLNIKRIGYTIFKWKSLNLNILQKSLNQILIDDAIQAAKNA